MLTLGEEMSRIGRHYGNRTAVVDESSSLSWKDFSTRIATAAGMLRGLGIEQGQRIAIYSRNSARFDELKWGAFHAGVVAVPINWRLAPPEIAHILQDSNCEPIFIEEDFVDIFDSPELQPWRDKLVKLTGPSEDALDTYEQLFESASEVAVSYTHLTLPTICSV